MPSSEVAKRRSVRLRQLTEQQSGKGLWDQSRDEGGDNLESLEVMTVGTKSGSSSLSISKSYDATNLESKESIGTLEGRKESKIEVERLFSARSKEGVGKRGIERQRKEKVLRIQGKEVQESLSMSDMCSPFYENVVRRLCAFVIEYIPSWVSPNALTWSGFMLGVLGYLSIVRGSEVGGQEMRAYFALGAGCWFMYGFMDNLDGHQARRLKKCSNKGEFLDHALDGFMSGLVPLVLGAGLKSLKYIPVLQSFNFAVSGWLPFFSACCAHEVLGYLPIGLTAKRRRTWLTVDEINWLIIPGILLFRGFLGEYLEMPVLPLLAKIGDILEHYTKGLGMDGFIDWRLWLTQHGLKALSLVSRMYVMPKSKVSAPPVQFEHIYSIGDCMSDMVMVFCTIGLLRAYTHLINYRTIKIFLPGAFLMAGQMVFTPIHYSLAATSSCILVCETISRRMNDRIKARTRATTITFALPLIWYLGLNFFCFGISQYIAMLQKHQLFFSLPPLTAYFPSLSAVTITYVAISLYTQTIDG